MMIRNYPEPTQLHEDIAKGLSKMLEASGHPVEIGVVPCTNDGFGFAYIYLRSICFNATDLYIQDSIYQYCKSHGVYLNHCGMTEFDIYTLAIRSEDDAYKLLAALRLEGY